MQSGVTSGTAPSSQVETGYKVVDSNSAVITQLISRFRTNGEQGTLIQAKRGSYTNGLGLYIDSSGNSTVEVSNASAWREALNVLALSGGTIAGHLGVHSGNMYIRTTNTIDRDAATPSANQVGQQLIYQDKDSERIAYIRVDRETDGYNKLKLYVYGEDSSGDETFNGLVIGVDRSGNRTVSVSSSAAWRTGLGLGSLSTKDSLTMLNTAPTGSTKDTAARASGANYQVNITVTSPGTAYTPIAVCAVTCNNANAELRGFDLDGITAGSDATLKTYWHANAAISANSATYTAQVDFIARTLS